MRRLVQVLLVGLGLLSIANAAAVRADNVGMVFTLLGQDRTSATVLDIDLQQRQARFLAADGEQLQLFLGRNARHLERLRCGCNVVLLYDEIVLVRHIPRVPYVMATEAGHEQQSDLTRFVVAGIDYGQGKVWIVEQSGGSVRSFHFAGFTWDEEMERVAVGDVFEGVVIRTLYDVLTETATAPLVGAGSLCEQSDAGHEAAGGKDCARDQLARLPSNETARTGRYGKEGNLLGSGQ